MRNRFLCSVILALAVTSPHRTVWGSSAALPEQPEQPAGDPGPVADGSGPVEPSPKAAGEQAADASSGKKKKKDDSQIRIKGRVFVRDTVSSDDWANDLDLASARIGAVYRDRTYGLRIEVEAEVAGNNAEVRDAYVRLDANDHVRIQAGRFKRPISAVSMASRWDLPVIERGYLNDFELDTGATREPDQLPLGGRFLGVTTTLRDEELPGQPELVVGVFRSLVHEQIAGASLGDRTPLGWDDQFPEDVFTRLQVEPIPGILLGASLAAVGQLDTAGDRGTFRHGFVTGLDAVVDLGPFRGWFEVFTGASPLHLTLDAGNPVARGQFHAARAIAAARVPVTDTIQIEPYAAFQILNSSNELDNDQIKQGGGGVNVRVGEGWRVQTAVDRVSVDSNPLLLYESATLFIVQLGAVF